MNLVLWSFRSQIFIEETHTMNNNSHNAAEIERLKAEIQQEEQIKWDDGLKTSVLKIFVVLF